MVECAVWQEDLESVVCLKTLKAATVGLKLCSLDSTVQEVF